MYASGKLSLSSLWSGRGTVHISSEKSDFYPPSQKSSFCLCRGRIPNVVSENVQLPVHQVPSLRVSRELALTLGGSTWQSRHTLPVVVGKAVDLQGRIAEKRGRRL